MSTYLCYRQVNYEHFTLEIDFLHLRPAEVIRFARALKRKDSMMVYTQVQLRSLVILKMMKMWKIQFNAPSLIYFSTHVTLVWEKKII